MTGNPRFILFSALAATVAATGASALANNASGGADSAPLVSASESQERQVDQAALDSQLSAIRKIEERLRQRQGPDREPELLFKLGEAQRQAASMQFRIAYGTARKKGSQTGLAAYKRYLAQSTLTLSELIRRYPGSPDVPKAYFLRAKSRADAGETEAASTDYLQLVRRYPQSEDGLSAYMALAEIAMDGNRWAEAAGYLAPVERHPDDPHYPHALYRQAWCQYNLKDVPRALSYIEREIRYYAEHARSRSDDALRENAVLDAALFFLEGYEQKLPHFGVDDAYAYFKRLEPGPLLGKLLVRYAKLLRSHGHADELSEWKALALREEPRRPETFEVIVIAYEDQLNKRQYLALVRTARELAGHRDPRGAPESLARAEKLLLDAAKQLQALISRNKAADGVTALTTALAGIYDSFTRLVDEKDPRIPKMHYNLAESLFEIGQFEEATDHYRWVVQHGDWDKPQGKDGVDVRSASLRAIASRYELLRKRGWVPGDLKPRSLKDAGPGDLDPALAEWIGWVDLHAEKAGMAIDNFLFEANRCIYAHGDLRVAVNRLRELALKYPRSKYAAPSATLVVDTYVASAEWEKLRALSSELLAVNEWQGTGFAKRLYGLASDADFKSVEAAYRSGDYQGAIGKAERFLSAYPESGHKGECLAIAGHAALSGKDRAAALAYFDQLLRSSPGSESAAGALLAEASIREEQYDFPAASRGYRQYLALPPAVAKLGEPDRAAIRKKALAFAWISGDPGQLRAALRDKNVCTAALASDCERYEALTLFDAPSRGLELSARAFSRARRGPAELRALWAALALEGARHLAFRDRHVAIRLLTRHWQELDSLTRSYLLSSVSASLPRAIALNRRDIRSVAPLRAREAYLVRRMEALHEIENAAMDAAKLPWARIRASVTNELADVYADSARSLASLSGATPAMAEPFARKAEALRAQAFQLASASAIEPDAFDEIAQPYLQADPRRMAALLPKEPLAKPQPLDPGELGSLDPDGNWGSADGSLKSEWYRAARQKRWSEATYLVQYANDKKLLDPGSLALLRAFTLAGMGAQAEALGELSDARHGLSSRVRRNVDRLLLDYYRNSLARERAEKLIEEMRGDGESVAQSPHSGTGG